MLREFTQDVGERFAKGEQRDYPRGTWDGISDSAGLSLDKFSRPVVNEPAPLRRKRKKTGGKK